MKLLFFPVFIVIILFSTSFVKAPIFETKLVHVKIDTFNSKLDEKNLSIITLNTWGLPIWYPKSNKNKRYPAVAKFINESEVDIILLQEVFDRNLAQTIFDKLDGEYKYGQDYLCSRISKGLIKMDCFGGLVTLSKYPILKEEYIPFPIHDDMKIEEKVGRKGILISTIDGPQGLIHVINTHMYSGHYVKDEKERLQQVKFIYNEINKRKNLQHEPIIFGGDFNIQHPSSLPIYDLTENKVYDFITQNLGFEDYDNNISKDEYTYDLNRNKYAADNALPQKLDYIMVRSCGSVCISEVSHEVVAVENTSVSDHNGFKIVLAFDKMQVQDKSVAVAND